MAEAGIRQLVLLPYFRQNIDSGINNTNNGKISNQGAWGRAVTFMFNSTDVISAGGSDGDAITN